MFASSNDSSDRGRSIIQVKNKNESYGSVNSHGRWACANILTTLTKSVDDMGITATMNKLRHRVYKCNDVLFTFFNSD
jgi:hypothetical protein